MPPQRGLALAAAGPAPQRRLPVPEAGLPPELVHSLLGSRTGTNLPQFPVQRDALARAAAAAGASNTAVAAIAARTAPPGAAAPPAGETPANPVTVPTAKPDPAEAEAARPKPPGAAPAEPDARPPGGAGKTIAAGSAPAPPLPASTNPADVQAAAQQTAAAMPQPPTMVVTGPIPGEPRRPTPRRQVQAIPGPPPIPMATPAYAEILDPIPGATKAIEAIAARNLPDQALPVPTTSPGGHAPDLSLKPLTPGQRRALLLGEPAMAAAKLPETERQNIRDTRALILAPPVIDLTAPPLAPPTPLAIAVKPLPPAVLTVAERDLFTAALAQLLADPAAEAKAILDKLKDTSDEFPKKVLGFGPYESLFAPMGKATLGPIETQIRDVATPMATVMGVAGKILDDAVTDRRTALDRERRIAAGEITANAADATAVATANADARGQDAATAKAVAADARRRAAAARKKPKPNFRETADASAARIKDKVSEAIAGFQLMEIERGKALDDALAKQLEACRDAVTADQLSAAMVNKVGPDQPALTDADAQRAAKAAVSRAINAAKAWFDTQKKLFETTVTTLKAETATTTAANIKGIQDQGALAFRALKSWGDTQDGATESWWADSARNLEIWADKASDTASTWADAKGKLARMQMQRDLETINSEVEMQLVTKGAEAAEFEKLPSEQRRKIVDSVVTGADNRADIGKSLAGTLRNDVTTSQRKAVEAALLADAMAIPIDQFDAIEKLAKAKNPNFNAATRSNTLFKYGEDKIGTNESAIYGVLTGVSPLEMNAIKGHYEARHGHSLEWALKDELSGDEERRGLELLKGNKGAAAAEAIHDAMWGPGTNEKVIKDALRSLTPTERDQAIQYYLDTYKVDLKARLAEDMGGSDLKETEALLAGDKGSADAIVYDDALRDRAFGPDRDAILGIHDRIREESLATAKQEGWTADELDAEITRRNTEIEARFGEKFGNDAAYAHGGGGSTLRTAIIIGYKFDPANRTLIHALADNDMPTADAALMQTERNGIYADDDVLKGVVRKQYDRGHDRALLDRGPEEAEGIKVDMKAWHDSHFDKTGRLVTPFSKGEEKDQRTKLQRASDARLQDLAFDNAAASSVTLDTVLKANHKISLDDMISQNMSWGDRRQAQSELKVLRTPAATDDERRNRRLDWAYSRVRYGIEGAGTTIDEVRGGLTGLDKKDLEYLDKKWKKDHDDESLVEAVRSDTSGREEDELATLATEGTPQTARERAQELREKRKRDEAGVGWAGRNGSQKESAWSHAEMAKLDALERDLYDKNLDPKKREYISDEFDRRAENFDAAIEAQRARVDAMADTIATVVQYIISAIAIIAAAIITIASGGLGAPALAGVIAITGSILGTVSAMAIKAAVKGDAYGSEEFLTDAVVGVVDLAVTIGTLGTVKTSALLQVAKAELKMMGRASLKVGLQAAAKRTAVVGAKEVVETAAKGSAARHIAGFVGKQAYAVGKDQLKQLRNTLPTILAANILNEQNLRKGNALKNIASGTVDGAIDAMQQGAVMGTAGYGVAKGLGKVAHVTNAPRTPLESRTAEFGQWKRDNPGRSPREFVAAFEQRQATAARDINAARLETRAARKAMLSAVPASEHKRYQDVPIVRVDEATFKAINKGQPGDAKFFEKNGQVVLVIREGAPPAAATALSSQLKATVAADTGGRAANAALALPPHLRNRVDIVPVKDPELANGGARVVPMDIAKGIMKARLEIGPRTDALDIQQHVATLEAARKFEGIAGKARQAAIDVGNAVGADIISPRDRGRWEAALEITKLRAIIDERMQRLAAEGVDPRRADDIAMEIALLHQQLDTEVARLALGKAAEARGYIAAKSVKKGTIVPDSPDAILARQHAQALQLAFGHQKRLQGQLETERARLTDPGDDLLAMLRLRIEIIREGRGGQPQRLEAIVARFEAGDRAGAIAAVHDYFGATAAQPGNSRGVAAEMVKAAAAAGHVEPRRAVREKQLAAELVALNDLIALTRDQIGKAKYGGLAGGGRFQMHAALPIPLAGRDYYPALKLALGEIASPERLAQLAKNINGFEAEMNLANHLAEQGKMVIMFGHKINEGGADMVSIDPVTGLVEIWDAKYHGESSTGHSPTFSGDGTRQKAVDRALKFLSDGGDNLPAVLHKQAVDALTRGNFAAVTSHTSGSSFSNRRITFSGGKEIARD